MNNYKNLPAPLDYDGQFYSNAERHHFLGVLASLNDHHFEPKKTIEVDELIADATLHVYDIDYYGLQLEALEQFDQGEFVLSQRIKFVRKYI